MRLPWVRPGYNPTAGVAVLLPFPLSGGAGAAALTLTHKLHRFGFAV